MSEVTLRISRRDAGRLLAAISEKRRKYQRGLDKFKDNWDDNKGRSMREGFEYYSKLERDLQEQIR